MFDRKKILASTSGFIIPFIPRFLFEVKNGFIQTHALINFFFKPSTTEPKSFMETFMDRINIFKGFYSSIFVEHQFLPWIVLFILIGIAIWRFKYLAKEKLKSFLFLLLLTLILFTFSLIYRNNAFWPNYYEGLPYIFVMMMLLILSTLPLKVIKYVIPLVAIIYALGGFCYLYTRSITEKKSDSINLKITKEAVDYVLSKADPEKDFCTKIYTPPIVPYTYDYLFTYEGHRQNINTPSTEFKHNKCFYIIESEPYEFRLQEWRKENTPKNAKKTNSKKIGRHITIEVWEIL
jgi:hypothetical protein